MRGISWIAKKIVALKKGYSSFEEGLCSMEVILTLAEKSRLLQNAKQPVACPNSATGYSQNEKLRSGAAAKAIEVKVT